MTPALQNLLNAAVKTFAARFNGPPTHAAAAPGRVNLIGEHTDYNDGFVLPLAIDFYTLTLAAPVPNPHTTVATTFDTTPATFTIDDTLAPGEPQWANYPKGVARYFLDASPIAPQPFNALIHSSVPLGSGLSSSAALEVSFATLLESITGHTLDPVQKALLCQKAEHNFAGAPCGIMDQFISTLGKHNHAMLLDCQTHQYQRVPLDNPDVTILIVNSNVKHDLSTGEYGIRRTQCEQAARHLGVQSLRQATSEQLQAAQPTFDATLYKRARHVITEIARTRQAAQAMRDHDYQTLGRLMNQSHDSLRDDYEVSCTELDLLVELTRNGDHQSEVFGSRMTGGGFGGCTVSLVKSTAVEKLAQYIQEHYKHQTGIQPDIITTQPADGATILELEK